MWDSKIRHACTGTRGKQVRINTPLQVIDQEEVRNLVNRAC